MSNDLDKHLRAKNTKVFSARTPRFNFSKDVVLSKESQLQIDEALIKIKYHEKIYKEWNFGSVDPAGEGVILNFYGKPGTGKTIAAEAFAGTINKLIIEIGIAELESKYMGETSTNIQSAFKTAKESDAVLFFDEADTLLGKRLSSVTQGVDNEVNASRSTLLMEIEKHSGVVIFATNFAENYDKAFENRISHHIYFPLPDLECRKSLWEKHLVSDIPLSGKRDEIINFISEFSAGFSGRDVRTCMRLSLPKALLESETGGEPPKLSVEHIKSAIEQIRIAHKEVGQEVNPMSYSDRSSARKLLGIQNINNGE